MHAQHDRGTGGRAALAAGLALILCGLSARDARAATWYTDQKATGNQDGKSWENATTTLDAGIKKLAPGDTLLVRGDAIYTNETFSSLNQTKSGPSPTQHTVVQGVPGEGAGELPLIWGGKVRQSAEFANDVPEYPNIWSCSHTAIITYDVLEAHPAGTYFPNIYSNHSAGVKYSKQTTLANVNAAPGRWMEDTGTAKKLYVNPHDGVMANWDIVHGAAQLWQASSGVSNMTITGFIMKQAREYTFRLYNARNDYITICGNTIVKRRILTEYGKMIGVVVCSNTFINCGMSFACVTNCAFFANTVTCPQTGWSGNGIYVSGSSNTVYNNVCISNSIGILLEATAKDAPVDCSVYNNTCSDNTSYNLHIEGGTNCAVYNNTLYNAGTYGLYLTKTSKNLKVFNNLVWERGSGDYAVYVDAAASPAYSGDHNDFHASDSAAFGYFGGANKTDLGEWRTATGQDANSISADPRVMSTGTVSVLRDFRLTRLSPCRNNGTASFLGVAAPAVDWERDARPYEGFYDIGSDEMTFPPPGTLILVN